MSAAIFCAGSAYALALWWLALRTAASRGIDLGRLPWWSALLAGGVALLVAHGIAPPVALSSGAALLGAAVCAIVDARTGYIFDALSVAIAGVITGADTLAGQLTNGVAAAALVGVGLLVLYVATGRRGIGLGDVKLGSAVALGFGPAVGLVALGSAFVLGAIYGLALLGAGRATHKDAVRFGPFIAAGAAVALIWSAASRWV